MKFVIIGNGVAGTECAINIRKTDSEGEIIIITDSAQLFYYRPKLIDYLAKKTDLEKMTIHKDVYYQKNNIKNILNTKIVKINPDKKFVVTDKDEEISYDKLLIATGARSFVPPVKGADKKGVFTVRDVEDCDAIMEYAKNVENILIVGGGLLGLETANSLLASGKNISVLEFFPILLPRQLDEDGASVLQKQLEDKGLKFILGDSATEINGTDKVESVTLKSGKTIKFEMVIISAGVRGRNELPLTADIKVDKGVLVNDKMETTVKDIYCAGDLIEHNGRLYGIWDPSKEQGKVAGINMAGGNAEYKGSVMANNLKVTEIDLFSAGDFNSNEGEKVVKAEGNTYQKVIFDGEKLIGAIILGNAENTKFASKVLAGKESVKSLIEKL